MILNIASFGSFPQKYPHGLFLAVTNKFLVKIAPFLPIHGFLLFEELAIRYYQ